MKLAYINRNFVALLGKEIFICKNLNEAITFVRCSMENYLLKIRSAFEIEKQYVVETFDKEAKNIRVEFYQFGTIISSSYVWDSNHAERVSTQRT